MGLPRSRYYKEGEEGVYHCFSRCVRRAFLSGYDPLTGRDFSYRKAWLLERLRFLSTVFAIEVCAYAVLDNHYHLVLRVLADLVAQWSDLEVARRWLTLFPRRCKRTGTSSPPGEEEIRALADQPERIALLRKRLCSLSWFMGRLNESIARAANLEDQVKGRFWESRFKCQALLDEAAIAACMIYVDLNPIRAGLAQTPEDSYFTSIQERIRAWRRESGTNNIEQHAVTPRVAQAVSAGGDMLDQDGSRRSVTKKSQDDLEPFADWLCPIGSDSRRRGILQMTAAEYFDLVDRSGRILRSDKRGAIDPDLSSMLLRIGAKPATWAETISSFGSKFRLAAGRLSLLRNFADQIGRRWLVGVSAARAAFGSS